MSDRRKKRRKRSPRGSLPFVYAVLPPKPACWACGKKDLGYYGQRPENDGSLWKYARCRRCGAKFIVVFETEGLDT
jgi:hypothetical protein